MLYILMISLDIVIYNDTYKFIAYPYNILQEFTVNNKVMLTSHPEAVKKLYTWRSDFDKILKKSIFIAYELDIPWDLGINSVFSRDDAPLSVIGA